MSNKKIILIAIIALIVLILSTWLLKAHSLLWDSFWNPKSEQVRREVFEQTKSYKQGMIQDMYQMQTEYIQVKPEHKMALRSVILHRSADFPVSELPNDLQIFIQSLKVESP